MYQRPCKKINCSHISYSESGFFYHQKHCKVEMTYQEHLGYVHMEKLLEKPTKKFASAYYQLMDQEERELLRGCLAKFHGELSMRKRKYEELQKIAETLEKLMGAANLVRELSSDSEAESPRDKRANTREQSKSVQPAASSWSIFGRGAQPPPPPPPSSV